MDISTKMMCDSIKIPEEALLQTMSVRMTALSGDSLAESCGGDTEKPFEPIGKIVAVAHVTGFRDVFQAEIRVQKHLFPLPEKKLFPVFPGGTSHFFPESLKKKGYTHTALCRDLSDFVIPLTGKKLNDMANPVTRPFRSWQTSA